MGGTLASHTLATAGPTSCGPVPGDSSATGSMWWWLGGGRVGGATEDSMGPEEGEVERREDKRQWCWRRRTVHKTSCGTQTRTASTKNLTHETRT